MIIRPQEGRQEMFLRSSADICIYGGAAGGGKTFALLLEGLRHIDNKHFEAVIFRQSRPQILSAGGLYATSNEIYPHLGATSVITPNVQWRFPSGAKITFAHMYYEKEKYGWQGSQIPLLMFDELVHFSEGQFFYMLSRNRSTCGVKPYIRATCNPDVDSWVASFISWWIDSETGYAIPERVGVLRYFYRVDGEIIWANTREELAEKYCISPQLCKSVTFIPSNVYDNAALIKKNPDYLASLNALSFVERERLLMGNWKIRPAAGLYFGRGQTVIVDSIPDKIIAICRSYDLAATAITPDNKDPDRTASVLMAKMRGGMFIILDVVRVAESASQVRDRVRNTARSDEMVYKCRKITIPQDPGQAGKEQAESYVRELTGYQVIICPVSNNKVARAEPFAAQWQKGNVLLMKGKWNDVFLTELEGFPDAVHDDQVDAASDAFTTLANVGTYSAPPDMETKESYWDL
ncbi:MAG: phage terminase large subunit [Schwartzia sp.]|nr:phage terminase large subunit [Schwartzia sp. (in: firmicutes)]